MGSFLIMTESLYVKDGYYKRIGLKDVLFAICVHYFTQTPLNEQMVGEFR